jgi:hypothetical protein
VATVTSDDPSPTVHATVVEVATGRPVLESQVDVDGDGSYRAQWPPLPPGDYRLTVSPPDSDSDRLPVHSLFIVAGSQESPT